MLPLVLWLELQDILFLVKCFQVPSDNFQISQFVKFTEGCTRAAARGKLAYQYKRTSVGRHFYFNRVVRLWNVLPEVNLEASYRSIKARLRSHFRDHQFRGRPSMNLPLVLSLLLLSRSLEFNFHFPLFITSYNVFISQPHLSAVLVCQHVILHVVKSKKKKSYHYTETSPDYSNFQIGEQITHLQLQTNCSTLHHFKGSGKARIQPHHWLPLSQSYKSNSVRIPQGEIHYSVTTIISRRYLLTHYSRKDQVDAVYLDFRKAFDSVPHTEELLHKLSISGINGKLWLWLKEYTRFQSTSVELRSPFCPVSPREAFWGHYCLSCTWMLNSKLLSLLTTQNAIG